jgi:hypothetical protein
VRRVLHRQVETLGYRVSDAESADAALAMLHDDPSIALVLTDVVMPGNRLGPDMVREARAVRPDLSVIYMSGYPTAEGLPGEALETDDPFLSKPIAFGALSAALRKALDGRR